LVDTDTAGLVRLEVEDYLRGSFLDGAPIVPVSTRTRAGLLELKDALLAATQQISGKNASSYFRLPIDRAFAIKGFGSRCNRNADSGRRRSRRRSPALPRREFLRVRGVQSGWQKRLIAPMPANEPP